MGVLLSLLKAISRPVHNLPQAKKDLRKGKKVPAFWLPDISRFAGTFPERILHEIRSAAQQGGLTVDCILHHYPNHNKWVITMTYPGKAK